MSPAAADLTVTEETAWTPEESAVFGDDPLLGNFAHYARHSTDRTRLSLAKVRRNGSLVGVSPLMRLVKYRGTRLLAPPVRKWVDPLMGPFARKTTCMIDASFMAFRYDEPFFAADPADRGLVRDAVVAHLKRRKDVDNLLISEPVRDPGWSRENGFTPFMQLPLVHVELDGCGSFDDYLAGLSAKRRKNLRKEKRIFEEAGATLEVHDAPLPGDLAEDLHRCLIESSRRNAWLEIPFEDVMNSKPAFETQRQSVIVARVNGAIAGFFAFIPHEGVLRQCHGGLDYSMSLDIKAYPNLIHAAVEHAFERGLREVTLGPLNNEAKRRAGVLKPVMASFWFRDAMSKVVIPRLLLKHFQVYGGAV